MDARSETKTIPLAVDLDGTLIASDLLWEGLFQLLRVQPLAILMLPVWFFHGGKARIKTEIANRVSIAVDLLPYREEVLAEIRDAKAAGRHVILATGSPELFAQAVATHLGCFDAVYATDETTNLTSHLKRDLLVERYGDGGFDYMGNSHADLAIFDAAHEAIVVAPDKPAEKWGRAHDARLICNEKSGFRSVVRMLRVHQWLKNTLIAVPMLLAHEYFNVEMIGQSLLAFVAFSATASSIYIINDLIDLPLDRRHATKRNRPFAAGVLSISFGLKAVIVLLGVAVVCASFLPPLFWLVLAGYLVATTAYSIALKRMLLIDVMTLAGLYTIRILAGAAATETGVSFWLLAFSVFFFLSLALVKRFVELKDAEIEIGEKIAGRGYRREDMEVVSQAGLGAGFSSTLVLALYIQSDAVQQMYRYPWMIWPLALLVLYIILRIWVLARRGEMHEDPVVFIMRDWRSQIMAVIGGVLLLTAAF